MEVRKLQEVGHAGLSLLSPHLWDCIILFPSLILSLKTRQCPAFQCPPCPSLRRYGQWTPCQKQHPQPAAGLGQPLSSSALPTGYQTPGSPSSHRVSRVQPTELESCQVNFLLLFLSLPIFARFVGLGHRKKLENYLGFAYLLK